MRRKINALGRIANYMTVDKRRIVMKTFIESHFNCCTLIWMFHSQTINNKINRLHERSFRIVYSDFESLFEGLLLKDNYFLDFWMDYPPFFGMFSIKTSQTVTIFEIIKNYIPEILKRIWNWNCFIYGT